MWIVDRTLLEIVLRVGIIYVVVLVGIRLTGKREVGQMTPFDLVLLLLIANAVQNAMTGPDTSVTGGLVAAGTLLLLNRLVGYVVWRSKKARGIIEGSATILIHEGKIITAHLAKEQITPEELNQALREHGIASISEVYLAVLEIDGSISVVRKDDFESHPNVRRHIRFRKKT